MKRSLRIALLLTSGTILRILVAFFILLLTVFSLYTQRSYIYSVLERTNTYERLPKVILNSSANQQIGQDEKTQLGSDIFAPIIIESTPPEVAELAAQKVINAHYDWLKDRTDSVEFSIDLSSSKEAIVDGITDYAVNRYLTLEECDEAVSGYDFFSVPCKVVGLDIDAQEESLREQLNNTPILLKDTTYTHENLLTDNSGKSIDRFAPWLKDIYRNFSFMIFLSSLAIVILIIINLLGATTKIKGIRRVGKIIFQGSSGFLFTAVIFLLILPLFGFGFSGSISESSNLPWQEQTYDRLFNDIISELAQDFILRGLLYSMPFALIGASAWLYGSYQLEKERHTGVSLGSRLIKATLENSGLVSSEDDKKKKTKKHKSEHPYPIASSEAKAASSKSRSRKRKKKKSSSSKTK